MVAASIGKRVPVDTTYEPLDDLETVVKGGIQRHLGMVTANDAFADQSNSDHAFGEHKFSLYL